MAHRRVILLSLVFFNIVAFNAVELWAQDLTLLGGELTSTIPDQNAIQVAAPNLTETEKRSKQINGFSVFHGTLKKSQGLGKFFINNSCAGCHVQNGKGRVGIKRKPNQKNKMVVRVSLPGLNENGSPIDVPVDGARVQLQDRAFGKKGVKSKFKVRLKYKKKKANIFKYPDGRKVKLQVPVLRYRIPGYKKSETNATLLMTPPIIGPGLLESIPEATVLSFSDPDDSNSDGISGRPQYVPNLESGMIELGRFGFKAGNPTVRQQSADAAFHDMGITNSLFNDGQAEPELSDENLEILTIYQALAGVPIARNQDDPTVQLGKQLFQDIGCDKCHKFNITTSNSVDTELDGQLIHPFTDLLLHDMGDGLADDRSKFEASGREWRTTPLWGGGFIEDFLISNEKQRFLHDGRAKTREEAILWHEGEAAGVRDSFANLSKSERDALIAFLRSI